MDLLSTGIVVGLLTGVALTATGFILYIKRKRLDHAAAGPARTSQTSAQEAVSQFEHQLRKASTIDEVKRLQQEIERKRLSFGNEGYSRLRDLASRMFEVKRSEIANKELVGRKLVEFRALHLAPEDTQLTETIHKIYMNRSDLITYDEVAEHGTADDHSWLDTTHARLIIAHITALTLAAGHGDAEAYSRVSTLRNELDDTGFEVNNKDISQYITNDLFYEWAAAVLRHEKDASVSDEPLFILDELDDERYTDLVQRARSGDATCTKLCVMLFEYDEDEISPFIARSVVAEFRQRITPHNS